MITKEISIKKNNIILMNKFAKLSRVLTQKKIHIIKINSDDDFVLDKATRSIYIDINRIIKYDHAESIDIAFEIIEEGYYDDGCQLVVN